jgi:hypothetical protein
MKHHNKSPQPPTPLAKPARSAIATSAGRNESNFVPSPDEVARKAYFSYVNQGSRSGHEVQHWLTAEAELIAERNLTRVHGFQQHVES